MPTPIPPQPGQESVWDYPRPPAIEATTRHLEVVFGGRIIAETQGALRVLETSHPPVYYFPPGDVAEGVLHPLRAATGCEWKGQARYFDVVVGAARAQRAAWSYPDPAPRFEGARDWIAFYPALMDECRVDGEVVRPQPGGFYGGWITSDLAGPFKGVPGSWGW